jgi:octaprenyl-diphosphate synthase
MLVEPSLSAHGHNAQNGRPSANGAALAALYAPIAAELAEVEELLRRELRSEHAAIDEMLRHGSMLGGKRLRPALLLLAAKASGAIQRSHVLLAAVVEMIHTATLIHDDILDDADTRRHQATCNALWDNQASVLLGDYLFTHAFYLASTLETTYACRVIGRATNTVCEGELRQVRSRGNFELSEEQYFEIIDAKTARLCECSCRLGAHYAGAREDEVHRLAIYGRNLGMAFQITDDLLDVIGDAHTTGKSLGTDLAKQKLTLPVIHALSQADVRQRRQIVEVLREDDITRREALLPWLERFDAVTYARSIAERHARDAREQLTNLPASLAREVLDELPQFILLRTM